MTLDGRDVYLGPYGTAASKREYDGAGVHVLTDRTRGSEVYGILGSFTIHSVRDTDGQPGSEIVVHVQNGAARGVHIIRPRTGVVKA